MTEKDKEALWAGRLAMWRASGQSMRGFALQQGWPPRQIAYWKKRLLDVPMTAPALIPVTVKPLPATGAIRLMTAGWVLELPAATPAIWLAELLHSL